VVVSELGRHTVGLMMDGVSQVVMVATSEIEPPALVAGVNDGQVCGVARLGDKLVLFLDPDRALPNRWPTKSQESGPHPSPLSLGEGWGEGNSPTAAGPRRSGG